MLQTLPQIKEAYIDSGKVRYIFKDFPLTFHANAQKAAEAGQCAGAQDAFWEMHEELFRTQSDWSRLGQAAAIDAFVKEAGDLGLDATAFRNCLESGQFAPQIAQAVEEGAQAGVRGTPSFLVNGELLVGAYPFENFQRLIEAALAQEP